MIIVTIFNQISYTTGEDMLILSDRAYVEEGQDANKKYLVIGLLLMGLGILSGLIYTFKFIWALK